MNIIGIDQKPSGRQTMIQPQITQFERIYADQPCIINMSRRLKNDISKSGIKIK